jgi:hypothetical protein
MSRSFLTGLNLNKNELLNARIQNLATAPSNPVTGQIYYDTDTDQINVWDGTSWAALAAGGNVGDQIQDAIDLLTTDDIEEGSTNLYFTNQRALDATASAYDAAGTAADLIDDLDTDDISEGGTNFYFTDTRAKISAADLLTSATLDNITITGDENGLTITAENGGIQDLTGFDTDDLTEGTTNLYFTDQRAIDAVGGSATSANEPNTVVKRDGNGDFSAGDITVSELSIGSTGRIYEDESDLIIANIDDTDIEINANDLRLNATDDIRLEADDFVGITSLNGIIEFDAPDGNVYVGSEATDNKVVVKGTLNSHIGDNTVDGTTGNTITDRIASALSDAEDYADALVQGLNVKDSVLRMSDANIVLESWNADGSFFDGVDTLQAGSRVLLTAQSTAAENGIYLIQGDGSLERAEDQPTVDKGDYVLVVEGTYAATGWIATSATAWTQFSAANEYTAGDGIDITGNEISIDLDGASLAVSGSGLKANLATDGGLEEVAGGIAINLGTGLTVNGSNELAFATGYGIQKYAVNNSSLTASSGVVTWTVTHSIGTKDVTVQVREIATDALVEVDVVLTSTTVVTLSWVSGNVSADAYRVVVIG